MEFPKTIVDKKKLNVNEEKIVLFKMLHRNLTNLVSIENAKDPSTKTNIYLMRNYNPGRHGDWNNYCSLKG